MRTESQVVTSRARAKLASETPATSTSYYCVHRGRVVDLAVTFHGPKKRRPAAGEGPELTEALRPRDDFKAAYYAGGVRIKLDGAPMRVAGHVAKWSTRSKAKIACYLTAKEHWRVGKEITASKP